MYRCQQIFPIQFAKMKTVISSNNSVQGKISNSLSTAIVSAEWGNISGSLEINWQFTLRKDSFSHLFYI